MFAVKLDGRHKARLVADGHLAPEPIENIHSGVVSLRNLRLVIFLGKLNTTTTRYQGKYHGYFSVTSLKDERYFDGLKRSLLIVARPMSAMRSWTPTMLQVVHLRNKIFLRPNKPSCSVSLMLTFKLTWGRPLSEDTWQILMLNQSG